MFPLPDFWLVRLPTRLQGWAFGPEELQQIQALIGQNGRWSRHRLSRALATLWNWRASQGQLKDMAARTLLPQLQALGWIRLPSRRSKSPTRSGRAPVAGSSAMEEHPVGELLPELLPLRLREVSRADQREGRRQKPGEPEEPSKIILTVRGLVRL